LESDYLIPSEWGAGTTDPAAAGLIPWINISGEQMALKRAKFLANQMPPKPQLPGYGSPENIQNEGILNNLVVYITFSDQAEFTVDTMFYYNMFNNNNPEYNSMLNYFETVSYNTISIPSWFYPQPSGPTVISYQDIYPRSYFMPYDPVTNPNGYQSGQSGDREHGLLKRACEYIEAEVPETLDLDKNSDGYIDNMVFTVRGATTAWSTLLWPHRWVLYSQNVFINGKKVWDYNLQVENHLNGSGAGVLCHEMFHSLSAPDLYHYGSSPYVSVGPWDLMDNANNPPQSMGAFMKFRYGGWIESIPEITECGTYTLNPHSEPENNCYKIASPNSSSQYYVLEYRVAEGVFEGGLPGTGLVVYRIDHTLSGNGNAQGPPDEVYVYRPNGTTNTNGNIGMAHFAADYDRTEINDNTNPDPFLQNGQPGGLNISNIGYTGETISFDVFLEKEPVGEFSSSEVLITPGCTVDFYDESICAVTTCQWTFEGGIPSSSTAQHPEGIIWNNPGFYTVTLCATNPWGSNTITKNEYIEVSNEALPIVEFFASDSLVCTGQTIVLNDYSMVCPNSWLWEITPNTFEFVNGSNANSQHIEIILNDAEDYTVSLTVTNDNGSNTVVKENYLEAGGTALPFLEDFENGELEARGWQIENPDDGITWQLFSVEGNGGEKSAGINLFNYMSIFKRDRLISPPINLSNVNEVYLSFDHAYAQSYNTQYTDSLIVKISTDCGNNWTRILELGEDGSYNFATHEPFDYSFTPAVAEDWCGAGTFASCNTINISPWGGQVDTRIMFESVRLTGNNLYVDNVLVTFLTTAKEKSDLSRHDLRIFPNPTGGQVTIILAKNHSISSLTVYNSMGEKVVVQQIRPDQNSLILNLSGQPRGIYFISSNNSEGNVLSKLVLQ